MLGAAILVVAMLVFIPMVVVSGLVAASILGQTMTKDAEARFEGSELVDLTK